jgi:hypothetical protein
MPIVIMPNGEMVDSVTGNPVNTPIPMPENMGKFIANRPMGGAPMPPTMQNIVITPTGELIDKQTGRSVPIPSGSNPVDFPMISMDELNAIRTRGLDPRSTVGEGELTVMQKMEMLMDMGLTEGEAIDAIAMEESAGSIDPRAFAGRDIDPGSVVREGEMSGMGALSGVPMGGQAPMPMPTPRPDMPDDMGADRTMNPMDRITPRNAPST